MIDPRPAGAARIRGCTAAALTVAAQPMHPSSAEDLSQLRHAAERMTDWRFHCWYWGDAIAVDGLLEAHAWVPAGSGYREHVLEICRRWNSRCPPNFDDALAPGAAIIQLVMDGDLPASAAERVLDRLEGLPRVYGCIPALEPHRPAFRFGVCIDAVYHLPATYAMAARWSGNPRWAERAVQLAVECMQVLRCEAGWAQWFDPTHRRNNQVAWSRGMGWAVLGLLDLVRLLDGIGCTAVAELAARVLQRLAQTQNADGNWRSVLDDPEAESETSTAAFYVAAALHPAARGLGLPAEVLERAAGACHRALAEDGTYSGVTADVLPSWDIGTYRHCPTEPSAWAQGTALRAFAALAAVRAETPK
jgi:unsaturated rhamnogalacturonyl hydrolase